METINLIEIIALNIFKKEDSRKVDFKPTNRQHINSQRKSYITIYIYRIMTTAK